MPLRDVIVSNGTMWPTKTIGSPGMWISHTFVDLFFLPLGKLIVRGDVAMHLLATSAPSMMKIKIAPVSGIAFFAAIVRALRYCSSGLLNIVPAVAVNNDNTVFCSNWFLEQLEIMTVAVSSSTYDDLLS
jgi:hypothetical protein